MGNKLEELQKDIAQHVNNPSYTVNKVLEYVMSSGKEDLDITDTTSPFVNLMQAGAVFLSTAADTHRLNLGKIYSSLAGTKEDIFMHLNETDFEDVFSLPSEVIFTFYIEVDTITKYGIKKANYHEIRLTKGAVLKADGVDYVITRNYDIRIISRELGKVFTTNDEGGGIVTPSEIIRTKEGIHILRVPINALQLRQVVGTYDISRSGVFRKSISVEDDFSKLELYTMMNHEWVPITTTYSTDRFDRYQTTAILTPSDGQVLIHIPPIYTEEGLVGSNLLAIAYSTLPGGHDFTNIAPGSVRVVNKDPLWDDQKPEVEAFSKTTFYVDPQELVSETRPPLTLEELAWRTNHRAYSRLEQPLTHKQVYAAMRDLGYTGILFNPHETQIVQTWILTSEVPTPPPSGLQDNNIVNELVSAPECGFISLDTKLRDLSNLFGVRSTDFSVTIPPEVFYKLIDGKYVPQSIGFTHQLSLLSPQSLADKLNKENIYYSPYYYNFYKHEGTLKTRIYDFKNPKIISMSTVTLTNNGNYMVLMDRVTISNMETHFLLRVETASVNTNDSLDASDLFVHLSWVYDFKRYYIVSEDIEKNGDVFSITFKLDTDYEIKPLEDYIVLTNALVDESTDYHRIPFSIDGIFNILFGTKTSPTGWIDNSLDEFAHRSISSDIRTPLSLETIHLDLGKNVKYLWRSSNYTGKEFEYDRYPEDVPLLYDSTSILITGTGSMPFTVGEDCTVEFKAPVREGDIVRDDDGNIVYLHRKGDIIYDDNGNPVILDVVRQKFRVEIWVFNAMAYFVTGKQKDYINNIVADVTRKSAVTILPLIDKILEHTQFYNYPVNQIGRSRIVPTSNAPSEVDLAQTLELNIIVDEQSVHDEALIARIRRITISTIDKSLAAGNVSVTSIINAIQKNLPPDVRDIFISGLGGDRNIPRLSLVTASDRLNLSKVLHVNRTGFLAIKENITISYNK